jgi:hypothetical protein
MRAFLGNALKNKTPRAPSSTMEEKHAWRFAIAIQFVGTAGRLRLGCLSRTQMSTIFGQTEDKARFDCVDHERLARPIALVPAPIASAATVATRPTSNAWGSGDQSTTNAVNPPAIMPPPTIKMFRTLPTIRAEFSLGPNCAGYRGSLSHQSRQQTAD